MTQPLSNLQVRDLDSLLHPYSALHKLRDIGPTVMASGKGIYVYDTQGKEYIEGMAGLWCTGLGFGNEELIESCRPQLGEDSFSADDYSAFILRKLWMELKKAHQLRIVE